MHTLHGRSLAVATGAKLEIGYDMKCNKPNRVTLNGESITVAYDENCAINKVDENLDPVMGRRIASLFSDLLEVSVPAAMGFLQ